MTVQRILVVDDDPLSRQFLTEAVQSLGYTVLSAQGGEEALERVAEAHPDLVLTDLRMPGVDGLSLCQELANRWAELPVVVITAHGSVQTAVEAMQNGASDFLLKPTSREFPKTSRPTRCRALALAAASLLMPASRPSGPLTLPGASQAAPETRAGRLETARDDRGASPRIA